MWTVQNLLVIFLVSVMTYWYISFLWKRRSWYIYSWNVPGPISFPFIGAAYKFLGNPDDILDTMNTIMIEYGYDSGLTKLWLGTRLEYLICDPNYVEKVLTSSKCLEKSYFYKMISNAIGDGLISAPVDIWKKHRKAIMPSFSQKILESFVDIFSEQAQVFVKNLEHLPGKNIDNLQERVTALTLDIIGETAMGIKMNGQSGNNQFGMHLEKVMEGTTIRIFKIWCQFDWIWNILPLSKEFAKHKDGFDKVVTEVITQKLEATKQKDRKNSLTAQIDEGGYKKKLAFLDLILENTNFSKEELRDEVNIFLIAGTDTTAITLCFFLEMMGMHQDIQDKVYEEIVDVIGSDRPVEVSDLPKLTYTERVFKETMRLFPVGAFFLRTVGEDLDLGDYILPAGTDALINSMTIHRHPKYWPDPLRFDPDRFLPEQVAQRHPCAFIPFSYGPRGCIGSKYAMMNMKTFAATTLRKYRFFTHHKSVGEINVKTKLVLRPKDGYKVYLETR